MNKENPFIGVSIQGATTTAQVSSSPGERPPYFSLASRSAIDCCEGPPGAADLIDSGAARHRSSSLLYPPGVQDRPIHPGPISEPYPFFLSDPGDEYAHWFVPLWRLLGSELPLLLSHSWEPSGRRAHKCPLWQRMKEKTLRWSNGRESTLQMNKWVGLGDRQTQSDRKCTSEKELIMMVHFDLKSTRQEDTAIFFNKTLSPAPMKLQFRLQYHFTLASLRASRAPGHSWRSYTEINCGEAIM